MVSERRSSRTNLQATIRNTFLLASQVALSHNPSPHKRMISIQKLFGIPTKCLKIFQKNDNILHPKSWNIPPKKKKILQILISEWQISCASCPYPFFVNLPNGI